MANTPSPEDTLKILIATDNHLGYGEKIPERCDDSFRTFEEILQLAVEHSVDFVLLGGDLFHEANPSSYSIFKCLDALRRYCLGDKPVEFEFLSDQSFHFNHLSNPIVNYEDPNLNISVPVFTIHGNHDDPVGQKQLSALDIVSSTGLVNYFGHWNDLTKVDVSPLLLKKGETKLALYGMSHIKDERLGRLFRDNKVTFYKSEGEWFNLLVLHQNRCDGRGRKNFVPETVIPEFLDLVIWGHEHDCLIEVTKTESDVFICQPGSSVATSLSNGESLEKKVGLLQIYKKQFKIDAIPLKTVRPFVHEEIYLESKDECNEEEYINKSIQEHAMDQVKKRLESMINTAKRKSNEANKDLLPLIRLIVNYTDERQSFNAIRVGQIFKDVIANPEDAILLKRCKVKQRFNKYVNDLDDKNLGKPEDFADKVEDVVRKFFETDDKSKNVVVCSVNGLLEAVRRYCEKNDNDAIQLALDHQIERTLNKVCEIGPEPSNVSDCLEQLRIARQAGGGDDVDELVKILDDEKRVVGKPSNGSNLSEDEEEVGVISDNDDTSFTKPTATSKRGRGSRGGTSTRGSSGRARRGRGRAAANK